MDDPNIDQVHSPNLKEFWDSLKLDIMTSNQHFTQEDYFAFIERSFMFSLFFRDSNQQEVIGFKDILNFKDNGYVILLEFADRIQFNSGEYSLDTLTLHHFIKNLPVHNNIMIGPLIGKRLCLLVTEDSTYVEQMHEEKSISLCQDMIQALKDRFSISAKAGIGSFHNVNNVYSSFIDSLSCFYHGSEDIMFYRNIDRTQDANFDVLLTESHLIESLRHRKVDAYDYFSLLMDGLRPLSDDSKRNKILELLVLANHTMQLDSTNQNKYIDYTGYSKQLIKLSGSELIEFAYKTFIYITSYVKSQNSIDYSNHIVKATKEYLEQHYTEDISLEDVAIQVNISPQYFSKLIKKTTGFNFMDWLSMLRVKKAKELLTNSNLTVKEVCFMVGYKDPNYFSRIFKKRIGITPSEFVKTSSYINNKN